MKKFTFHNKNILIISPEPWDFVKVSKHHYARALAVQQNKVFFLNPPVDSFNVVHVKKEEENLYIIDYNNPYKGVRFFPRQVRKFLFKRLFLRFQGKAGLKFDTVFLFENSRFYDLDFLPKGVLSVYFQVDEDQRFHPKQAASSANLVLAINDIIKDLLSAYRKPVFKISHGFSGKFTETTLAKYSGEKIYKRPGGRLKAYYVGNLDHGFSDTDLIADLVKELTEVDFIFIGPYSENGKLFKAIKQSTNTRFIGQVPADKIPFLLDEADLVFFAYRDDFLSSSHKVMEYLASGKAIVTTRVLGYPDDKDLFFCSGTAEKFIPLFREVCNHIEEANSPARMKKRIGYAMENTYKARLIQIEELINDHYNKKV